MSKVQKITPFLWFNDNAEQAMEFYLSVFENSKKLNVNYNGAGGPGPEGSVMIAAFELEGQQFLALNGGPLFQFTEAISFAVNCDTQDEIDELWEKLSAGGEPGQCGWVKDRSQYIARVDVRSRSCCSRAGDAGIDADDKTGYCTSATGCGWRVIVIQ